MRISRTSVSDVRLISDINKISESDWVAFADHTNFLLARNKWYPDEYFRPNYFICKDNKPLQVELRWRAGVIFLNYSKLDDFSIVKIDEISTQFEAIFFLSDYREYPRHKIIAAQRRLSKKTKEPQIEYQKVSFGGNNMWLAIRATKKEVMDFFKLEGEQKDWAEALDDMHSCKHMFLYEFRGWTFLAGQLVDSLFTEEDIKGEEAIEKLHVDKLLEWGKTFTDIQLYMHYDRSMYFNAFYRVLNGEMLYGEYETESYQKTYGKMPKNVKDLPDNNANTIAIEWSYEPDYLRYQMKLENAKAWVVNVKESFLDESL